MDFSRRHEIRILGVRGNSYPNDELVFAMTMCKSVRPWSVFMKIQNRADSMIVELK